jgi:hypothetical protein
MKRTKQKEMHSTGIFAQDCKREVKRKKAHRSRFAVHSMLISGGASLPRYLPHILQRAGLPLEFRTAWESVLRLLAKRLIQKSRNRSTSPDWW